MPYLCRVTFAGLLNLALWRLNPTILQRNDSNEHDCLRSGMDSLLSTFLLAEFLMAVPVRAHPLSDVGL